MRTTRQLVRDIRSAAAVANPYRIARTERWTGKPVIVGCYNAKNHGGLQVRIPTDIGWLWVLIDPSELLEPLHKVEQ